MYQVERQERIVRILEEKPRVTVEELAQMLQVTAMTIRRDLKYLESVQIVSRTFGGAVLKSKLTLELPNKEKVLQHKDEKEKIAVLAASMVEDGQTIILDAGTTTMAIAHHLDKNKKIVGIITSQDVVEAVDDELGEDYAKLAGLASEEDITETTKDSVKKRLPWLIILLFLFGFLFILFYHL